MRPTDPRNQVFVFQQKKFMVTGVCLFLPRARARQPTTRAHPHARQADAHAKRVIAAPKRTTIEDCGGVFILTKARRNRPIPPERLVFSRSAQAYPFLPPLELPGLAIEQVFFVNRNSVVLKLQDTLAMLETANPEMLAPHGTAVKLQQFHAGCVLWLQPYGRSPSSQGSKVKNETTPFSLAF